MVHCANQEARYTPGSMPDQPAIVNNVYYQGPPQSWLDGIEAKLDALLAQGATIMSDLTAIDSAATDIQAKVAAAETVQQSAETLLTEIADLLRANASDPAAIAAIADRLTGTGTELDAATNALAAAVAASSDVVPPPA